MKKNLKLIALTGFMVSVAAGFQNCGKVAFTNAVAQSNSTISPNNPNGGGGGGGGGGTGGIVGGVVSPACVPTSASTLVVTTLPPTITPATIAAICPSLGSNTECGTVIIVTDGGSFLYYTGEGPYDGSDDTLVGVLNISSNPVNSIVLNSNKDIMGFDGDGLDNYQITGTNNLVGGNIKDASMYGGPNAYYTNISNGNATGTVNFLTPVAAGGGTTFFGLENSLASVSSCLLTTIH